ncbi:hypothetical protein BYT27DRAFT_6902896 [Phlegmacium glaucopus]|nr:hypothetical protein BYT27DRAFT_6902896 [Phlegmacium glaucopus]
MYSPAHVLSKKSAQQERNVFIWCSHTHKIIMGWRVDTNSPTSISTAHRWITTVVQTQDPDFSLEEFTLFPIVIRPAYVLTYTVERDGLALSRASQENIVPGDYGIYEEGKKIH